MDETNITSAKYKVDLDGTTKISIAATIDNKIMTVPLDPANRHYAEILKQVKAGTLTIEEAD
jgi:hypothetical protein